VSRVAANAITSIVNGCSLAAAGSLSLARDSPVTAYFFSVRNEVHAATGAHA
jgi:hypothetical protein